MDKGLRIPLFSFLHSPVPPTRSLCQGQFLSLLPGPLLPRGPRFLACSLPPTHPGIFPPPLLPNALPDWPCPTLSLSLFLPLPHWVTRSCQPKAKRPPASPSLGMDLRTLWVVMRGRWPGAPGHSGHSITVQQMEPHEVSFREGDPARGWAGIL